MKKFYFNLTLVALCLVALTSCSRKFNFVTKGLPNTDSSYLVTTAGKRIDASVIEVKTNNKLTVDGEPYSLEDLSIIRSKKMYFGVKDGELYLGDTYGKICILYKMMYGSSYQANSRTASGGFSGNGTPGQYNSTVTKVEYLQKRGSTDIDKLNAGTLIDYVSDNEQALALAKGGKIWGIATYVPFAGFAGGAAWTVARLAKYGEADNTQGQASLNVGAPLLVIGASLTAFWITSSVSYHKIHKAIKIYNSTPNDVAQ